jgi:hypothetical protein
VDLVQLSGALDLACRGTSLGQCREQEAEKKGDDGHHHKQLDEREAVSLSHDYELQSSE